MKQVWPYLTGFGLAVAGAFVALAYLLIGGREQVLAIVIGIGLLAIAQIMVLGINFDIQSRQRNRLRRLTADVAEVQNFTASSIDDIQSQLTQLAAREVEKSGEVMERLIDIKTSFAAFSDRLSSGVANQHGPEKIAEPEVTKDAAANVVPTAPFVPAPALADQINYALEPVVDIPTQRTAHYRLHATMSAEGELLSEDTLLQASAIAGKRPAIDSLAVAEALGLLGRLRQRDPHLCILVAMGSETLQDHQALADILGVIQASIYADGLIIELPHVVLAGLSENGLEGLALLARSGVVFALSQASVNGLDLEAMKTLNVRMVGLKAATLSGQVSPQTLSGFAQMARLARINIYVTDVSDAGLLSQISSVARLACGPCFAPPRRVKRVTESASSTAMAA